MDVNPPDLVRVKSRIVMPWASVELQEMHFPVAIESTLPASPAYRLDLCLTPRPCEAGLSFERHWPAHHYERPGKLYMVPPGEALRARSSAGTQTALICQLDPDGIAEWMGGDLAWTRGRIDASLDIQNRTLGRLLLQLGEEARHPGFASGAMCGAISVQIAIELGRHFRAIDEGGARSALAPWQLRVIDERLEQLCAPPLLEDLALLCGISVRHLTRGFRGSRGCSIGTYIANRRIEIAKQLLGEGETVDRIAYRMGFASRSSFSHAFCRATGVAPRQFRQSQQAAGRRKH